MLSLICVPNFDLVPLGCNPIFSLVMHCFRIGVFFLHGINDSLPHRVAFIKCEDTLIYKLSLIETCDRRHLVNLLVHEWLRETGLIELIVTAQSIANQINNDVMLESHSVVGCHFEGPMDCFDVIGIYMEDWCTDGLGEVRSIHTTSSFRRHGGETNLVVHDDVDRTTNCVIL